MKVQELRLGNLVSNMYEKTARVREIHEHPSWAGGFLVITDKNRSAIDTLRPIPLTAEWLEKLGFNRDYDSDSGWRKNILREWVYLYCDTQGYFEISVSKHSCPVKIKQVHQLQNLYSALTGEELTIKEDTK